MSRVAFLCLGTMGYPMAGHLCTSGHDVTVYNRTPARAEQWVREFGGGSAATPREAVAGVDVALICTGNDRDVRDVLLEGGGALAGLSPGAILVDHTTGTAELARELAVRCREAGIGFLDAPVSGGQSGAEQGQLTVMVGGDDEGFRAVEPLLLCYGKKLRLMGPAGSGQLTKMVNQICIAGLVQALSEGLHFAQCVGLDAEAVVDVISQGAAQSWQMDNRARTMLEGRFDFGFAVDWMRKDLGIALAEAERNAVRLEITERVDSFYAEVQAAGGARWDTSSLITRLK